ncbi:MAG: NADH-quinone oxidoreductase subunit NuoN [Alphaproteobacteria bacterium]
METQLPIWMPAVPEIILAVGALVLLMLGVFSCEKAGKKIAVLAMGLLLVVGIASFTMFKGTEQAFFGQFVQDKFSLVMKMMVLVASLLTLLASLGQMEEKQLGRFEYPVLFILAVLGMFLMLSANDLIALYVGLELQSLALYVLASFDRDNARSSEAGLKYFVLGALSSGMLLYGSSLVYGFTGTTNFDAIGNVLAEGIAISTQGVMVGMVFLLAGIAFKISAAPFHMWTPDVYEGAPTPVTTFFAAAPKIAALGLLTRLLFSAFEPMVDSWRQIILLMAVASMIVGALAAVYQNNMKRLLAYSSIANIGYILLGLAAGTTAGIKGMVLYMAVYAVSTIGSFAVLISLKNKGKPVEKISDMAGLSHTHPLAALALAAFMLSLAGIPPLVGFFGKMYVFMAVLDVARLTDNAMLAHVLYAATVVAVVTSVVAAYYYLRILKVVYFDQNPAELDHGIRPSLLGAVSLAAAVVAFGFLLVSPLVQGSSYAAAAFEIGEE